MGYKEQMLNHQYFSWESLARHGGTLLESQHLGALSRRTPFKGNLDYMVSSEPTWATY